MNKHAIIRALEALNPASIHTHSISLDQVTRRILDGAKLKRKALSKQEITKYGLNIYPKSGVRVEDLIDWLITNNDIEVDQGREKKVRITPQGVQHLMELYTDHHCAAPHGVIYRSSLCSTSWSYIPIIIAQRSLHIEIK